MDEQKYFTQFAGDLVSEHDFAIGILHRNLYGLSPVEPKYEDEEEACKDAREGSYEGSMGVWLDDELLYAYRNGELIENMDADFEMELRQWKQRRGWWE